MSGIGIVVKLCSIFIDGRVEAAVMAEGRILTLREIGKNLSLDLPIDMLSLIEDYDIIRKLKEKNAYSNLSTLPIGRKSEEVVFAPPFRDPPKIWGIGLNYVEHASQLRAQYPDEPASFMKPKSSIIGHQEKIVLPDMSHRVTAEAELGIVIGKRGKDIEEVDALSYIFGYVPVLDMTAEDILQKNPRFLTRAKSFDTFFSFGPFILTPDEIENLDDLTVKTTRNNEVIWKNQVKSMKFGPRYLISFHSHVFTFELGDILSTGTPGATVIKAGDVVECQIDGFPTLVNPVIKKQDV